MVYNPVYTEEPLTDFSSVGTETDLNALNLNWREKDLPERIRTKHVHKLHPYLGKFVPQIVEVFLRKFDPEFVIDPFCGSGTTVVEALALGIPSFGVDISEFNCLLSRVKTAKYDIPVLEKEVKDILTRVKLETQHTLFSELGSERLTDNDYLNEWYAPQALRELLTYRDSINDYRHSDVLKVILSRSARSARLTTHYDLDFPKKPVREPYECYKHGRICKPTEEAFKFLRRYSLDTVKRIKEFSKIKTGAGVTVLHGDSRSIEFPEADLVITSPPYIGLIDYHEQHKYAFELLGLKNRERREIGAAKNGRSKKAKDDYVSSIAEVLTNVGKNMKEGTPLVIIANDSEGLYPVILEATGYTQEAELKRHVNRRTGRRSTDFYESIFIWRV
jgi:hypothetical protein